MEILVDAGFGYMPSASAPGRSASGTVADILGCANTSACSWIRSAYSRSSFKELNLLLPCAHVTA